MIYKVTPCPEPWVPDSLVNPELADSLSQLVPEPATQMSSRHRRNITLHVTDYERISFNASTFDSVVGECKWVSIKELMLIPKTIREVERCLLLFEMGRAVLTVWKWADHHEALRLLTRLIGTGSIGKASVARPHHARRADGAHGILGSARKKQAPALQGKGVVGRG